MVRRGLPATAEMRHDAHYVDEFANAKRSVGRMIAIDKIEPNPEQPRNEIGDLSDLSASIKQHGVLEPLLVKPIGIDGWMIIAGERRWRAATMAGLSEVPCIEMDIDEKAIAEIALIENLQRKDLTIWEEADGLLALSERFGYTHEEIARKISKSRTTVTESLSLANLPQEIREKCRDAKINAKSTLLEIARQFDEAEMLKLIDNIKVNGLSRSRLREEKRPQKPLAGDSATPAKPFDQGPAIPPRAGNTGRLPIIRENITTGKLSGSELAELVAAPLQNASTRLSSNDSRQNLFMYVPPNHDFRLEIKFHKKDKYSLDDVVEALKRTLDYWERH